MATFVPFTALEGHATGDSIQLHVGFSGPEKGGRDHGDAVRPSVGGRTCGHHCSVEQLITEHSLQPFEVDHITVIDGSPDLDFKGQHSSVITLHNQVNLVIAVLCPEVECRRFSRLRTHSNTYRHQGFEETTE